MPQTRSRHPGGKSRLTDFIRHTIFINDISDTIYCELFSGGAGVAVSLLLNDQVHSVILNDADPAVYSVWYAVLHDTERLITGIRETPVTMESWHSCHDRYMQLRYSDQYDFDLAFSAFFLNRTNRSGIIPGGPIGGMSQSGKYTLDCRFNKEHLIHKIRSIQERKERITLYNHDVLYLIRNVIRSLPDERTFIFFDPPYYRQGGNLYHTACDDAGHVQLSEELCRLTTYHWIITYDNTERIQELYPGIHAFRYDVQYTASRKRTEKELVFHSPRTCVESFRKIVL